MTDTRKYLLVQPQVYTYSRLLFLLLLFPLLPFNLISQNKDTVYIKFNEQYDEMKKVDLTRQMQARSTDEKLKRSVVYYIEQMEPPCGYNSEFKFAHVNRDKETYKEWGLEPPTILHKEKFFSKRQKDTGY